MELPKGSVAKELLTTAAEGNRQGFLDRSNRRQFDDQRRTADKLEAERQDMNALEAAEKKRLKKPEGDK